MFRPGRDGERVRSTTGAFSCEVGVPANCCLSHWYQGGRHETASESTCRISIREAHGNVPEVDDFARGSFVLGRIGLAEIVNIFLDRVLPCKKLGAVSGI